MRFLFNPFTDKLDISGTGPGGTTTQFVTGNSGGPVPSDAAFNINILGDNTTGINTIGNLSPSTLTIFGIASSTTQVGTTRYATNAESAAQLLGTASLTPANITSLFSTNPLPSSQGGTGLSSPAANSLIVTNGSSAYTQLGVASNGQLPIGSIGSAPVLNTLTAGAGVTITNGPGTITVALTGGGTGIDSFSPDTGTDPVVPDGTGLVDIQGQATPNVSGIQVTGGLNRLDLAMFSPFGGGNFGFSTSNNGGAQTVFVENTSNTASSDAVFSSIVGGTSAGDPYSHWVIPATRFYAAGIDNSDSDTWKLTTDVSPVSPSTGTTLLSMTSAGAITIPTLTGVLIGNGASAISANAVTNHAVLVGAASNAITSVGPTATAGQVLQSAGAAADPAFSTATYPATAGTSGKILISNGTNIVSSTPTYPNASVTAGKVIISDGTNYIASTPTFPNSATGTGKILRADGTNWVATTATYPDTAGTSGNVLTSDGTNWTSAAPTGGVTGPGSSTDRAIATWNGTGGTALFNNSTSIIDSSGRSTNTSQPIFQATPDAQANVTGDGTTYVVIWQNTSINIGSWINTTTGIATTPVAGNYLITGTLFLSGILITHTRLILQCAGVDLMRISPFVILDSNGDLEINFSTIASLGASTTFQVELTIQNGTKVVDIGTLSTFRAILLS